MGGRVEVKECFPCYYAHVLVLVCGREMNKEAEREWKQEQVLLLALREDAALKVVEKTRLEPGHRAFSYT